MAFSSSPIKYVNEPFPGITRTEKYRYADQSFIAPVADSEGCMWARDSLLSLAESNDVLRSEGAEWRTEKCDASYKFLLIKEVHGLFAFPYMLPGLDYKVVVITRNITRAVDSYFYGHTKRRRTYLIDEYNYLKKTPGFLAEIRQLISPGVISYLMRPKLLTTEFLRRVAITEVMNRFLINWAEKDDSVIHVEFEELCYNPVTVCQELYDFMGLQYDDHTIFEIKKMTTGKNSEYYATDKNSVQILNQDYKYLTRDKLILIENMLRKES